jgi:heme O synthase-like polyprenyltransferase
MRTTLIVISSVVTVASVMPYLLDILKGKTKPRVVSWFTWSVLTAIASAASLADHQYASAVLTLCATIETAMVVTLGIVKSGDRTLEKFDIYCLSGAVVGLLLWLLFNSPAIAVAASVIIDFVGMLPTIKHTWQKPHEETRLTFVLASIGGLCTVFAASDHRITAVAYPVYIVFANALLAAIIIVRHRYAVAGEPAELREL